MWSCSVAISQWKSGTVEKRKSIRTSAWYLQGVAQWGGRSSQRTCGAQSKHRVASTLVMTSARVDFKEAEYSPIDERCQIRPKIVGSCSGWEAAALP
jgi:hypothetical protein